MQLLRGGAVWDSSQTSLLWTSPLLDIFQSLRLFPLYLAAVHKFTNILKIYLKTQSLFIWNIVQIFFTTIQVIFYQFLITGVHVTVLLPSVAANVWNSFLVTSSSFAFGPSGWEGGEGATQSEPMYRDPQRGSREHTRRGEWQRTMWRL